MTQIFEIVLNISLEAGILALLIIGARVLIKHKQALVLTILFAMLIVKLILPLSIHSPLSLQNFFQVPKPWTETETVQMSPTSAQPQTDVVVAEPAEHTNISANTDKSTNHTQVQNTDSEYQTQQTKSWQPTPMEIAAAIWLLGIAIISVLIMTGNVRFMRKLKRNRSYSSLEFDMLLNECKRDFNIKQNIDVVRVSEIQTAAVYGVFKPKLLISPHTFETLGIQEKRHVIMHELSHIKRKDTLLCVIITILNIIHWFNPIVWIAFMLMRKDIEIMCDAKVLRKIGQCERQSYARTLLSLFTRTGSSNVRLVTALFMSKTSIKRRIMMIAKYKKRTPLYTALGLVLTLVIAVTGCTTSVQGSIEESPNSTSTQQPKETVKVTESASTLDNDIISDLKLITTNTFDFSSYSDARAANIKKTAVLLDNTIIEPNEDNHLVYDEPITIEDGWLKAPSLTWDYYMTVMEITHWSPKASDTEEFETMQMGGGIDLVLGAIHKALAQANIPGVRYAFLEADFCKRGDLIITTGFDEKTMQSHNTHILLKTIIQNSNLIVEIYGDTALVKDTVTTQVEPELMTSYTLDYRSHKDEAAYDNIGRALTFLDGTVIKPGEVLSINSILGPRTEANGWKAAPGVANSRYAQQYGGGVCAVSSALYNAAIRAELEIVERYTHAFPSAYVTEGMDATISTGGPDLKIRNPYDANVIIQTKWESGLITIEIYGPPMEYTVDFISMLIKATIPPETIYHYNSANTPDGTPIPPGKAIEWVKPRDGTTWNVFKVILDEDGNEVSRSLFSENTYKAISGIVYVNNQPANKK